MLSKAKTIQTPVFFDNDGAMDDIVSLLLLLTNPQIKITGISLTDANCTMDGAVESVLRVLALFGNKTIQIAKSDAEAIHPFPEKWRKYCSEIALIKTLQKGIPNHEQVSTDDAAYFTAQKIFAEPQKTTYVLTGPASNLSKTISLYPKVKDKIEQILWMGGAFLENGNVKYPDHDGSAEWNFFWDPHAAKSVLQEQLKIYLFPLDACVHLPVDSYIMYHLGKKKTELLKLVHKMYEPFAYGHSNMYFWDAITAAYLAIPDFVKLTSSTVDVEVRGTSMGNVYRTAKGNPIRYASYVDDEMFYDYLLEQLKLF